MNAKAELDHALANVAMGYRGVTPQGVQEAKQHVLYGEMLAELEARPYDRQKLQLACHLILQGCGYELQAETKSGAA